MTIKIEINGREIGPGFRPYIIAEMSANHNGNFETAIKILDAAKQSGVDAIKIQTYTPDTITLNCSLPDFQITEGLWAGHTLYELYEWAHTPWEWNKPLFDYANKIGLTIFSSPFDNSAVDLLEELNTPAYKIASFEAVDLPLIRYAAKTGKPLIISTGMADEIEILEAIEAARSGGCKEIAILHCVSGYPAPAADYNLKTIPHLINRHNRVIGLSDHTIDSATAIASVALGASIIEKHFTLDRNGGGPDDSFSVEPNEMAALCRDCYTAWSALGSVDYSRKSSEHSNVKFRRSIYAVKNIKEGEEITEDSVRIVRPGFGLSPKYYYNIIGRKAARDISENTPIQKDLILGNL